jgi:hypothetical protein
MQVQDRLVPASVLREGDPVADNAATFGLHPPAGIRVRTVMTLSFTPAPSNQPQTSQPNNNTEGNPAATPELGRSAQAGGNMSFQGFSDSPIRGNFIPVSSPITSPSPGWLERVETRGWVHETITELEEEDFEQM